MGQNVWQLREYYWNENVDMDHLKILKGRVINEYICKKFEATSINGRMKRAGWDSCHIDEGLGLT